MAESTQKRIEQLVKKKSKYYQRMSRLHDLGVAIQTASTKKQQPSPADQEAFISRFKRIDNDFQSFDSICDEIEELNCEVDEISRVEVQKEYENFEVMYFALLSMARVWKISNDPPPPSPALAPATETTNLKSSKIDIEPFDGDVDKWPNFYALFDVLVHKQPTYSKVEKMTRLRSLLRGHALALIESLPITSNNYPIAYQTLLERFQNTRSLAVNSIDKILSFRPITTCTHASLVKFLDVFSLGTKSLKNLGIPDLFDFTVLHLGLRALPETAQKEFDNKYGSGQQVPSFNDLVTFIQDQIRFLECSPDKGKAPAAKPKYEKLPKTYDRSSMMAATSDSSKPNHAACPKCSDTSHKLFHCPFFKSLNLQERHTLVRDNRLCERCLGFHNSLYCRSGNVCTECKLNNHHSLLHPFDYSGYPNQMASPKYSPLPTASPITTSSTSSASTDGPMSHSGLACNATTSAAKGVLLASAVIMIHDRFGVPRPVKAVLDNGSQVSAISEACVQRLSLPRRHGSFGLVGLANSSLPPSKGIVYCSIASALRRDVLLKTECQVMSQISAPQPNFYIDEKIFNRFKHLTLADPAFHKRSAVEFLLGADLYASILAEPLQMIRGEPSAFNTIFGWVIGGPVAAPQDSNQYEPLALLTCCQQLDYTIRRFWEIEEVHIPKPLDPDDVHCEQHFIETHSRDESGRFVVRLPFAAKTFQLPNTRGFALKSLDNLEKRLKRNPDIFSDYRRSMNDYIELGYISLAKEPADYVIPHHCVIKESSTTTKVRPVFNASFTNNSLLPSLNDILLSGPKLQKDICDILTNMRLGNIVVCCDIRAMYLQVKVHEDERAFQHIFYRPTIDGPVLEYQMNTLVFGVKPSAFLAQRCLAQLVEDNGASYPLASDAILNQTFVDNICQSVDSLETAFILQKELVELFSRGGFMLRKWASNRQEVLDLVPPDHREHTLVVRHDDDDHAIKILGLQYTPADDAFSYHLNLRDAVSTKRGLMSEVARVYDPLGWLAPVVFIAKSLIQQTWKSGLTWDDPLSETLEKEWERFHCTMPVISELRIPRFMPLNVNGQTLQILGFCDASELGYAATIYVRSESASNVSMYLITAKSRLAPLKTVSIPRLELCGAQLLTKLLGSISSLRQKINISSVHLFTDSSTTLAWIRTAPHKLKTYVSNRVVYILEHSEPHQWAYVRSEENPSDCTTRGLTPEALVNFELWWKGPPFAHHPRSMWPFLNPHVNYDRVYREFKSQNDLSLHVTISDDPPAIISLIAKFSELSSLKRAIAHLLRFIRNFKARKANGVVDHTPLTPLELEEALQICIKATQEFYFSSHLKELKQDKVVSSKLVKLTPFIDSQGFLRVGGRLRRSNLPVSMKHPLIIPNHSHLANLLCDYYHYTTLHGGPRLLQSLIQRKYWIIAIRRLLRLRIHKCTVCVKMRAQPVEPIMSDLPPVRVQEARPFLKVGIDFAGPFTIKESHRRKAPRSKGYMALFVCMVSKAVHLEFCSALSTPVFLAALDRFVARRGLCSEIYSDCGTNFQGAANHFHLVRRFLLSCNTEVAAHLANRSIKWNFITPAAPHQGGLWEAGVKSAKHHLTRILGSLVLTFEEMSTVLTRVEAVLNSRPLGVLFSDPNEGTDYLTPGHFLIGVPLLSPPELELEDSPLNLRDRYQILQKASQCFWRRWSKDYLQTLIPREKWTQSSENLRVGDVVCIRTANTAPLSWPIGRIEEIFPGVDGVVRNAKIRTATGTYSRPVQKLVALPRLGAAVDFAE